MTKKSQIKKLMWAYLLKNGTIGKWNHYSGNYDINVKKVNECINDIKQYGVNWSKTKNPSDGLESAFTSTFDDAEYNKVLEGKLILNNGKKYEWALNFQDVDFLDIIEELVRISGIVFSCDDFFDSVVTEYHFENIL